MIYFDLQLFFDIFLRLILRIYLTLNCFFRMVEPVIIEEIHVYDHAVYISNMQLTKDGKGGSKLIIISDDEVKAVDLQRCHKANTCRLE